MKFFKRKEKVVSVAQVPLTVLMREIIYDAMMDPIEGIAEALGLPPISEDVADMEAQASEDRLHNIAGLLPFIDAHADIVAKISTSAYMLDEENDGDISSEQIDHLNHLFRMVALSSAVSCVSTLNNIGLIESRIKSHE